MNGPQRRRDDAAEAAEAAAATSVMQVRLLVFWCGAVLMGLEIAGSRVLAPYFGNSVFVWGSLITVFLAALACGNYLGGWLADRRPSLGGLTVICIGVSIWLAGLSFAGRRVCAALIDLGLGNESGPLVAALVLFLPPSVGLGAVPPFAVRLAASSIATVGKVSGSLYALSTIGSIAGTVLTTFVLIPWVGVTPILRGLGLSLLIVAAVARPRWTALAALVPVGAATFFAAAAMQPFPGEKILFARDTPYHDVSVSDHERGIRLLRFDRYVENMILTAAPHASLVPYTNYFHLGLLARPPVGSALFIGAGGGVGPRTFQTHSPGMRIDVVDIDPAVLEAACKLFFLEPSPAMRLVAADGRSFLRQARGRYDCIVLDAFTIGGRLPFHLCSREFFTLCRGRMADDGVFVMNINSAVEGRAAEIYRSIGATLAAVFPRVHVFVPGHARDPAGPASRNVILLATAADREMSPEDWSRAAKGYDSASYVDGAVVREMVRDLVLPAPPFAAAALTDDYCPIETMTF